MPWDGMFEGSFKKRADKPNWKDKRASAYDKQFQPSDAKIPLAVHHVTDWEMLRGVWNRMMMDKHFGTVCSWLYAVGFDVNNTYYETDAPQSPAEIVKVMIRGGDVGSVADPDEIHARVTWSTWNLVEGPKENTRSDDRGNFHDTFSKVKGLTETERANMKCTDNVYTAMSSLNLSGVVDKNRALALSKSLLAVNRNADVIKYRPEMWIQDGVKWRKNVLP